jgi:hypothetical protein
VDEYDAARAWTAVLVRTRADATLIYGAFAVSRPTFALRTRRLPRPFGKHRGWDGDHLALARHVCAEMENIGAEPGLMAEERRNKDDADLRDHDFQPWGRLKAPVSQGDRGGSKLGGTGETKTIIYFESGGMQQLSSRVCQVPNLRWADVDSSTDVQVRRYLLSRTHPVGRFKAAELARAGFEESDWRALVTQLRRLAVRGHAVPGASTAYGQKYFVSGTPSPGREDS